MDRNSFKYWYKKSYENIDAVPPKHVWDNISNNLEALATKRRRKKLLITLPCIVSFSIGSLYFVSNNQTFERLYNPVDKLSSIYEESIDLEFDNSFTTKKNLNETTEKLESKPSYEENSTTYIAINDISSPQKETQLEKENVVIQRTVEKLNFIYLPLKMLLATNNEEPLRNISLAGVTEKKTSKNPKLNIGGGYHFTNSTLLNSTFYQGKKEQSLVSLKNNLNHNFSLIVGWEFAPRWILEGTLGINNLSGQKYTSYKEGNFVEQELKFKHSKLTILAKRETSTSIYFLRRKAPINLMAGVYGSYISQVDLIEHKHNALEDVSEDYNSTDVGLSFGLGLNYPISKKVNLQPQIISSIGMKNLFNGDGYVPANFDRTRTLSASPGISLQISL